MDHDDDHDDGGVDEGHGHRRNEADGGDPHVHGVGYDGNADA